MSNHLAIATVTASLQKILQAAVQLDVEGARVTTVRPGGIGTGTPETGVNIYLYRVFPVNWRNGDLPTRRSSGELKKRPQIALNLDYIITCYGNESDLEPQRLLGSVVRTLHANPTLDQEIIRNTVGDRMFRYLADSDLANQVESIVFAPQSLSMEDLSKIWSIFFQTAYALSVAYQVSAVLIESDDIPRQALPVRQVRARINPYQPVIDRIVCEDELTKVWRSSSDQPILPTSTIKIYGQSLESELTQVRLGNLDVLPQEVTPDYILLSFGELSVQGLRAGAQGLQVVQRQSINSQRILESNVLSFVLRPLINEIQISLIQGNGQSLRMAQLLIRVNPLVGQNQRVVVFLNECSLEDPHEYSIKLPPRETDIDLLVCTIPEIKVGVYLVRVQVDGVDSLLNIDTNPENDTYEKFIAPLVTIT